MVWVHRWVSQASCMCCGCHLGCTEGEEVGNLVWCGIIIAVLVMFLFLVILFYLIEFWVFAILAMTMHAIWTSHEKVEASVTYQSQLIMCDLHVIDDSSLILPLFATPGTEHQITITAESIRGMDILEVNYFRWLQGWYKPKEMDVLGWVSCCPVGTLRSFLPY